MKKLFLVVLFLSALLISTGCASSEPAANASGNEPVNFDEIELPAINEYEEALTALVPLGEKASTGITDFTIIDFIRPADEIVAEATNDRIVPEAGKEYVVIHLIRVCAAHDCYVRLNDMRLIGSAGMAYRPQIIEGAGFLKDLHVQQGAAPLGYVAFLVDQNEGGFAFCYKSEVEAAVCMATE